MDLESRRRLSAVVRQARGNRSQRQFAKDLGVSYASVQSWERCDSLPSLESLEAIANSQGLTLQELLAQIRGEDIETTKPLPKVAEDVLPAINYLSASEQARLIKLIVDQLVPKTE